jgi:2'-5' RNA ligase
VAGVRGGIYVVADLRGETAARVRAIQRRYDPKLAAVAPPHITLTGSSGLGPIDPATTEDELRRALEPVARETPPIVVRFGTPVRFMQTTFVVLPIDPHGPIRELHDRIGRSGLRFLGVRHMFTPHATLSLYPELSPEKGRAILAERVEGDVRIDAIQLYRSMDPMKPKLIVDLPLTG